MIQELRLYSYKGFERFTLRAQRNVFIVGPNNAGKSTVISAIRALADLLRMAKRERPKLRREEGIGTVMAFPLDADALELRIHNVHHEFEDRESRLELEFDDGAVIHAVWPPGEADAYVYLTHGRKWLSDPAEVRRVFPTVGWVPALTPLDENERLLDEAYARRMLSTRLASRHFRNQLWLLTQEPDGAFEAFQAFSAQWMPELALERPHLRVEEGGPFIDAYYGEGRTPKEAVWAGDGFQVWMQLLLHVFRLRSADVILLDEPDTHLHADLQRRLVRLLESTQAQAVLATHAPEIVNEAEPEDVVWVDRRRTASVSSTDFVKLAELSEVMGSRAGLALAKALTSKLTLFVEGQDMKLVGLIAEKLGAEHVAREIDLSVVPIEGQSNWRKLQAFPWLAKHLLQGQLRGFVLLDRDYLSDDQVEELRTGLRDASLRSHIWRRKELESYLIEAEVIARLSGAPLEEVRAQLERIAEDLRHKVQARILASRQEAAPRGEHYSTVAERGIREFDELWKDQSRRLHLCPAKKVLSGVNAWLAETGLGTPLSFRRIAREVTLEELPEEMVRVVDMIEDLIVTGD